MISPKSLDFLKFFLVNFVPELKDSNLIINYAILYESLDQAVEQIELELRPNDVLHLNGYEMGQRVDVRCQDKNDNIYIIEIQDHPLAEDNLDKAHYNLKIRNAHYVARAFGNQQAAPKESKYSLYNKFYKVILINICNFNIYSDEKEFIHDVYLCR
jgi:hypothetical protein